MGFHEKEGPARRMKRRGFSYHVILRWRAFRPRKSSNGWKTRTAFSPLHFIPRAGSIQEGFFGGAIYSLTPSLQRIDGRFSLS